MAARGVTSESLHTRTNRSGKAQRVLTREQELKLLQVERWLRGLPSEEGLARLARIETALRSSIRPVDRNFVEIIVAWRLHRQLRPS
jgi:hypothetical protein